MLKGKNWLSYLIIVLIILVLLYFANNIWNRDVVPIKTAIVTVGTLEAVISASGIVDAPVYDLGTKLGGKIANLEVKEGDHVRQGQLLAVFDSYEQARNDFLRTKELYEEEAASQQSYDAAKTLLDASRIIAPNTGIVAKIVYREGETVVPGSSAVIVVNYDKSWVEAQIDEIDFSNVHISDKVKITSDVYPDKVFDGEVYWIAPLAELRKVGGRVKLDEESYVFPCKIKFLGNHEELKVNMSVNVDIISKKNDNAVIFPREALVSTDEATYVFLIKNNKAYKTRIDIGIRSYSSVEAISGLNSGDVVAISNITRLKDNGRTKNEK